MRFLLFFCFLFSLAGTAFGQYVPTDRCAVVVASRPTLAEAQQYRAINTSYRISAIYLTQNGWYALVADTLPKDGAPDLLTWRKAKGLIPKDSFCSSGKGFVEPVWPTDLRKDPPLLDANSLFAEFDARRLSIAEKRFLQAALALAGDYDGRLDGQWGQISQSAFERWSVREYKELPSNLHAALLAATGSEMLEAGGWGLYYDPDLRVSMQLPFDLVHAAEDSGITLKLEANDGSFDVMLTSMSNASAMDVHHKLQAAAAKNFREPPYVVRNDGFWVTSFSGADIWVYQRSDFGGGSGFARAALFTSQGESGHRIANLLIASYQLDPQADLTIPPGGALMGYLQATLDALSDVRESDPDQTVPPVVEASRAPDKPDLLSPKASGSGFYINDAGSVMTNEHVVAGCSRLAVDGTPARLGATDEQFDLAVVTVEAGLPASAAPLAFAVKPVRLNSDVTVAGYPLNGLLDALNVTRGSVSALKGMDNDATRLQITAPVQAGNSGGPIVDSHGQIVGVVVSKMNSLYVADIRGDLPQNVNFGVRGSIARIFAEANGIEIKQSDADIVLAPEDLAELLAAATVLIECYRARPFRNKLLIFPPRFPMLRG